MSIKTTGETIPESEAAAGPNRWFVTSFCWLVAIGAYWVLRNRGQWAFYVSFHEWMASIGISRGIRNLDSLFFYIVPAFIVAWRIVPPAGRQTLEKLLLAGGRRGWFMTAVIASAPMVVGGALLAILSSSADAPAPSRAEIWNKLLSGVVRAPIGEEFLFRGLLVALPAWVLGWRGRCFWINATGAGLFFGLIHVTLSFQGILNEWGNFVVPFIGGMWYTWLLVHWRAICMPITLHAGMNLGWLIAQAEGGASGGGGVINLLRVATIVIATVITVRMSRRRVSPLES